MSVFDLNVCTCSCHEAFFEGLVDHVVPCCDGPCEHCGRNVLDMKEHLESDHPWLGEPKKELEKP